MGNHQAFAQASNEGFKVQQAAQQTKRRGTRVTAIAHRANCVAFGAHSLDQSAAAIDLRDLLCGCRRGERGIRHERGNMGSTSTRWCRSCAIRTRPTASLSPAPCGGPARAASSPSTASASSETSDE